MTDATDDSGRNDDTHRRGQIETLAISICRIKGWPEPDAKTLDALLIAAIKAPVGPNMLGADNHEDVVKLLGES